MPYRLPKQSRCLAKYANMRFRGRKSALRYQATGVAVYLSPQAPSTRFLST